MLRSIIGENNANFGLDATYQISSNQIKLMKGRKWMFGSTMDRIAIWQKNDDLIVQAIDQQDFNLGFSPVIRELNKDKKKSKYPFEVHSLTSHASTYKTAATDYLEGNGPSILENEEKKDLYHLKLGIMKVIHGQLFFSDQESQLLVDWFKALSGGERDSWKKYICKIHNTARLKNIRGYENSPLRKVITD